MKSWINDTYIRNTISWLEMYKSLEVSVENALEDIERIENSIRGKMGSLAFDKEMISKTYKFNSVIENEAVDNVDETYLLKQKIEFTKYTLSKIKRAIEVLPEKERELIEMRYLSGKYHSWQDIASNIGYSIDHCKGNMKRKAVEKISVAIYGLDAMSNVS